MTTVSTRTTRSSSAAPFVSRRTFMLAAAATGGAGIVSSSVGLVLMGNRPSAAKIDDRRSQMESPIEEIGRAHV